MISSVERSVAVDTEGRMAERNSSYPGQDDGGRGRRSGREWRRVMLLEHVLEVGSF